MDKNLLKLFIVVLLISTIPSFAQPLKNVEITEGTEYWFGIPHVNREAGEAIRGTYPIAIWVSSKVDTKVKIEDAETGSSHSYNIKANEVTEIPYGDGLMMTNAFLEIAKNFGIHITADDPVSVTVYLSYRWSGESFKLIPVSHLGKKYVTVNMWQDQTDKILPCEILIVSPYENNRIIYRPTAETKLVKPNKYDTVYLKKGDCYLIESIPKNGSTQNPITDLTGTYIESSKPVCVISGHSKMCYPAMQKTFLGRPGNFMRNTQVEQILPVELLDSEYISAPLYYTDRTRGVMTNDSGDLIRFVAAYDSTRIYRFNSNLGYFEKLSGILMRGQYFDIVNQSSACYYRASKPVLVSQFGKQWLDHLPTPEADKKSEKTLNPYRSGQGMLINLIPISRWVSYACFRSPAQIDDFVYLTFALADSFKLYFDGIKLLTRFPGAIKKIPGTKYGYINATVAAGDHWISNDNTIQDDNPPKFMAYSYGNWDRSKDGFAYGTYTSVRLNNVCQDSFYVKDNYNKCGQYNIEAHYPYDTTVCGGLIDVQMPYLSSNNFELITNSDDLNRKYLTAQLKPISSTQNAYAVLRFNNLSGKILEKTYEYYPSALYSGENHIQFDTLDQPLSQSKLVRIYNSSDSDDVITGIYWKKDSTRFKVSPSNFPITIKAHDSLTFNIEVINSYSSSKNYSASIIFKMSCYDFAFCDLSYFSRCVTSIRYIDSVSLEKITATAYDEPDSSTCSGFYFVDANIKENYSFHVNSFKVGDKKVSFSLTHNNLYAPAHAQIVIKSLSEKFLVREYNSDWINAVNELNVSSINDLYLFAPEPNPAADISKISFYLPSASQITAELFNSNGELIAVLFRGFVNQGTNSINLDFGEINLSGGLYFIKISSGSSYKIAKLVYMGK